MKSPYESRGLKIWSLLVVAMALMALWQYYPLDPATDRLDRLPLNGLGFKGENIKLDATEAEVFGKAKVLKRIYRAGGITILLTVIDGTKNRHAIHDPSYCIRGGGWSVVSRSPFTEQGQSAEILTVRKKAEETTILYWYATAGRRHASPLRYWMDTSLRRLLLGASGPEPVLVHLQPLSHRAIDWHEFFARMPMLLDL